jgi:hypothetical protein
MQIRASGIYEFLITWLQEIPSITQQKASYESVADKMIMIVVEFIALHSPLLKVLALL